jgi:hypothetical protein
VYNITRQLSGRKTHTSKPVTDKNGKNMHQLENQLDCWKEHFFELLNGQEIQESQDIRPVGDLQIDTDTITVEEITKAVKKYQALITYHQKF